MAKFCGVVGYGESVETKPGVWEDVVTERKYYGDVLRNTRMLKDGVTTLNEDLTVNNSISILADTYANERFFAIRYVKWAGTLWQVNTVEKQSPRLILSIGGVYNGQQASAPDSP